MTIQAQPRPNHLRPHIPMPTRRKTLQSCVSPKMPSCPRQAQLPRPRQLQTQPLPPTELPPSGQSTPSKGPRDSSTTTATTEQRTNCTRVLFHRLKNMQAQRENLRPLPLLGRRGLRHLVTSSSTKSYASCTPHKDVHRKPRTLLAECTPSVSPR